MMIIEESSCEIPIPDMFECESFTKSMSVNSLRRKNSSSFPFLNKDELAYFLLKNNSEEDIVIIDARFNYEFSGGHIIGAYNITNKKEVEELFYKYKGKKVTFVFHCEFSHDRAPTLLQYFRSYDRIQNQHNYPNLTHENVFLLEGGYSRFYEEYPHLCTGGYTKMFDKEYSLSGQLQQSQQTFNHEFKKSNNLASRRGIARCRSSGDNLFQKMSHPSLLTKCFFTLPN